MNIELKIDRDGSKVSCFTDGDEVIHSHNLPTYNDVTIGVTHSDGSKKVVLFLNLEQAVFLRDKLIESVKSAKARLKRKAA